MARLKKLFLIECADFGEGRRDLRKQERMLSAPAYPSSLK